MCQAMSGLPPASRSGLGVESVSGRMRSPRPAASSIALKGVANPRFRLAFDLVQQLEHRPQLAVALAGPAQIPHHQGHVLEVAVLAVAMAEAGEDAEHLDVALYAHPL